MMAASVASSRRLMSRDMFPSPNPAVAVVMGTGVWPFILSERGQGRLVRDFLCLLFVERSGFTAPEVREVVCLYQGHEWCQ